MVQAVYEGPVTKQTLKRFSHDGAIRIQDDRHLRHCQAGNSLTWKDQGEWVLVKPRELDMQQIADSLHEIAYDPGNARYLAYGWNPSLTTGHTTVNP